MAPNMTDRSSFTTHDTIAHLWSAAGLPTAALSAVHLTGDGPGLPSSFKVGHIAQATVTLSALAAATTHAGRNNLTTTPRVTVPLLAACLEFKSTSLWTLDSHPPATTSTHPISGLHETHDGHILVVDTFPHLRQKALALTDLTPAATGPHVRARMRNLSTLDLEAAAHSAGATVGALRSFTKWDAHPQSAAVADQPVRIHKLAFPFAPAGRKCLPSGASQALAGVKVLDLSRVIAAPVAGRVLAAHGADVLWVTSPGLPERVEFDRDTGRGKRRVGLDLDREEDRRALMELVSEADVVIQSYRPGALAKRGLGVEEVVRASKSGVVYATLSAFGAEGPWSELRGFDSLVQAVGGFHVAEAEAWGAGEVARHLPTQVLDYGSGFLLAFGIMAALHRQAAEGGSFLVEGSLAATMKYVRSLGQYQDKEGFFEGSIKTQTDVPDEYLETKMSGFGELRAVKHSATIEAVQVGWDLMPKPLGFDIPAWI